MEDSCAIRFKLGEAARLHEDLLSDERESFSVLLGKTRGDKVITVHDRIDAPESAYSERCVAGLHLEKAFVYEVLSRLVSRVDVDTLIDVHTHPFAETDAWFSGADDRDEERFFRFLNEHFDGIHYASIVLTKKNYRARVWTMQDNEPVARKAEIKTQMPSEYAALFPLKDGTENSSILFEGDDAVFNRSVLALGLDTMRAIAGCRRVAVAGVGGLGSIIAEHLVHMGFHNIVLIDHDRLELSNLNRIAGATYQQAREGRHKVEAVREHLLGINPYAVVTACAAPVESPEAAEHLSGADFIMLATDNHSSRFFVQKIALEYFVPMISAGVNISVEGGEIRDVSGEVITVRAGDGFCLRCLGRINMARIAAENHPDPDIRKETIARGYVEGMGIKEPAVKTLNAMVATMAVDALIDQFVRRREHNPILVYENNRQCCVYPDRETLSRAGRGCSLCDV